MEVIQKVEGPGTLVYLQEGFCGEMDRAREIESNEANF